MKQLLLSILKSVPQEPLVRITALVLATGLWSFIEITNNVLECDTRAFDDSAVRILRQPTDLSRPMGPSWLPEAGRDVAALGGVTVLLLVIAVL